MNLKNKKVLITGATGGIGNSLVKKFNDFGSTILATGTNEENLKNEKNNILLKNLLDEHVVENFETAHKKTEGLYFNK